MPGQSNGCYGVHGLIIIIIIIIILIIIIVIIGACGLVKKRTENYIGKIPGNIRITELQKIVLLGTAHILRRTLSIK